MASMDHLFVSKMQERQVQGGLCCCAQAARQLIAENRAIVVAMVGIDLTVKQLHIAREQIELPPRK